jgi:hypothetical protein
MSNQLLSEKFGCNESMLRSKVPAPDFSPGERVFKPAKMLCYLKCGL